MTNPVLNIYDTDEKITLTINNQGPIGLSAYDVWLAQGNTGSEQDFLDSLQGDGVNADWLATSGNAQILNKPTLATVATTGSYVDLLNTPTLGSAAALDSTAFATASQGALANTAVQPGQLVVYETTTQLNNRDAANRNRANHTGTQSISTITGTKTEFNNAVSNGVFLYVGDVTQYTDELAQDAVGSILTDTTSIDLTYNDVSNSITADVKNNSTTQRIEIAKAGALISTRKRLNLIEGSNVTLTITDDNINDEVDVTISATGGGGGGGITNLGYTASATNGTITSSTGTSATIPAGNTVNASLMLPADKTKLDAIETGAQINTITSVAGRTGAIVLTKTDVGLSNVVNLDTSTSVNITDSLNKRFVTDAQRTVLTNTSGVNTGDQTTIVGITGTKIQFNNAVTDGDILYVGDVTQYTDEQAQDAVGNILTDTNSIDFIYNDASNLITADVKIRNTSTANTTITASGLGVDVINNTTTQRIEYAKAGTLVGTRKRLNFIEGSNVTLTITDDNINDEVDVTISATGGGGGGGITNLGYTASATEGIVTSSTGTSAIIPAGNTVNASLMLPADKTKLNGIETGAQVNTITSVAGRTGAIVLTKTDVGLSNVVNLDTSTSINITDSLNKRFVTDAQRTVLTNTSGVNTGDQATIVGITGTKTEFNNAVSNGDFLYIGDVTQYTDELAQDAVGNILTDTNSIDFIYNDTSNLITADVKIRNTSTANTTITASGLGVDVINNTTTQRIEYAKAGTLVGTRKRLNFIEGSNVIVTVTDDNVNDEVDVTISSTITDGDRGDITVSSAGTTWTVDPKAITYAKIQDVSSNRLLGRITAGSGSIEEVTGTQATSLLNTFTSSLKGLAPASGGGTTNFLRADGTWAAPAGGGGLSNTDAIVYALIFG